MAWITAADVTAFAPQFANSATSTPTTTQATTHIANIESEVKAALTAGGYSTTITADDLNYVKLAALNGMAAWIGAIKQTRGRPGAEGADSSREVYAGAYASMLAALRRTGPDGARTGPQILSDASLAESSALFSGGLVGYHELEDDSRDAWEGDDW